MANRMRGGLKHNRQQMIMHIFMMDQRKQLHLPIQPIMKLPTPHKSAL